MENTFLVSFPKLGLDFNINSTIDLGVLEIRWYALFIVTGMVLAVLFSIWEGKRIGVSSDTVLDVALISIPSAIVGARLYYVLFSLDSYKNFWDVFKIWEGGLAIYGGIIAGVAAGVLYLYKKKLGIGKVADLAGMGFLIGQSIGRWGNFMNGEAYGGPTNLPWGMFVEGGDFNVPVHPTFLYESLWNVIGFIALFFNRKHKKFDGEIFLLYVVWYGIGRPWIEGLRADSLYLWSSNIRVSQLLAILAALVGIIILFCKRYKLHKAK